MSEAPTLSDAVIARRIVKRQGMALFPGIQAAARDLGVNRTTLYRVLKGQFPDNHGLRERYAAWSERQAQTAPMSEAQDIPCPGIAARSAAGREEPWASARFTDQDLEKLRGALLLLDSAEAALKRPVPAGGLGDLGAALTALTELHDDLACRMRP